MEIKEYTKEDFLSGLEPYEFLYQFAHDGFMLERMLTILSSMAQAKGVKNFKKLFNEYLKKLKKQANEVISINTTQFDGQPFELDSGQWRADEYGVSTITPFGEIFACNHPIMPVKRLVNIDTGVEKMELAYRRGRNWRKVIYDKKTLSSSNAIVGLSDNGIGVNSENAKYLVRYIHDVENLNYEVIPEMNCVSRLGWIEGEGFAPYVGNLIFDGDPMLSSCFNSVKPTGSFEVWKDAAKKARQKHPLNKAVMSASFSSVLVKHLGINNFMLHLWGNTESAKTVSMMLGASAWANPSIGEYIQNWNSTNVGRERMLGFLNNLPLMLDELQVIKDKKQFDQEIYSLCEGSGRLRGNKTGGTDKTSTWQTCIISTGEMPIATNNSGGGAVNRVIDIECKDSLIDDPREFCNIIKKNYGHAGKYFIENINLDEVTEKFNHFYKILSKSEKTEKQSSAAAAILTTDYFISKMFFDDEPLTVNDLMEFLKTKKEVSIHEKAYEHFCSWVAENSNKFRDTSEKVYGKIDGDMASIVNNVFIEECSRMGYNYTAFLSFLKSQNLIDSGKSVTTKVKKVNGINTRCVVLKMVDDAEAIFDD